MRMYDDLAPWWPLLSPASEYAEEAAFYTRHLASACDGPIRTVLELGSGGGSNASHMKAQFEMTLVEPSPGMRAVSEALNPECRHAQGDMRTVDLGQTFDAVFVQDAIGYMLTEADLRRAIQTAYRHCRPGGAALFAPDFVQETFRPGTDDGGIDAGGRGLRYLEWSWDPDPDDTTYNVDYAILLREEDGSTRSVHDRHVEGLFARQVWLRILSEVGFQVSVVPLEHSEVEPGVHEVFVAKRPRDAP